MATFDSCVLETKTERALAGRVTTIELRNELVIEGEIVMVDLYMNVTVSTATLRKLNGKEEAYEQLFIHGNKIRYVHIPEDLNLEEVLEKKVRDLLGGYRHSQLKRKRVTRAKLDRQEEEKAAVRAYKLGRGRAMPSISQP